MFNSGNTTIKKKKEYQNIQCLGGNTTKMYTNNILQISLTPQIILKIRS
jgi:hypothetical protein